jgi:deazaflavin-dependent oxidoreductase (nitroreductase family)
LFGQEHVDRYRETDGEEGHDWQGTTVLLLTTTGRNTGAKRTAPLIYQRHGDDYLVAASNGGGDPPGWFLNLQDDPIVAVRRVPGQGRPRDPGGGPRAGLGQATV